MVIIGMSTSLIDSKFLKIICLHSLSNMSTKILMIMFEHINISLLMFNLLLVILKTFQHPRNSCWDDSRNVQMQT